MEIITGILAIIGFIAIVVMVVLEVRHLNSNKPNIPQSLFEDCRNSLVQLEDWYYFTRKDKDMARIIHNMINSLYDFWADFDMSNNVQHDSKKHKKDEKQTH